MSFRGSFVTEYIYCSECFNACKEVLCNPENDLSAVTIGTVIIAGMLRNGWIGGEFHEIENIYIPQIQKKMCDECKIRIAVLSEGCGNLIYEFDKNNIKTLDANEELKED